MEAFKPGDYYEDCSYHPCLCVAVDGQGGVSGISLIDGSSPRSCNVDHCGIRKLTLDEAVRWKRAGPQDLEPPWTPLPDQQWWWPRPVEGLNPGGVLEFLFESSLNYLRNFARPQLGEKIVGWHAASGTFSDHGEGSAAEASYEVRGSAARGFVRVEATKEGRLWPIHRIALTLADGGDAIVFEGDSVRGCGHAG